MAIKGRRKIRFAQLVGKKKLNLINNFMADESAINLNKPSLAPTNNENEQNGSRNDVLVKIGLVGDAQVFLIVGQLLFVI